MLKSEHATRAKGLDELMGGALMSRLDQVDLASRKVFAGKLKGERRSKKRGQSAEFADHRAYVVGDDLRHLDWNIYGRLDRLFIKLFLEEEDLSLNIVIDCSASMDCGEPSKFLYAQKLAAAIGYIGLVNLHRVSLTAMGGGAEVQEGEEAGVAPVIRNLRGRRRLGDMGRWLCALEPRGGGGEGGGFEEAAKRVAMSRSGKGVVVVISDFFFKEGYEAGLRRLVGRGRDVLALQTLSPQEVEPTLGGDLRLRDIEDGDVAEVTISAALLKRYKANLNAHCDGLRAFCARRDMTHLAVGTEIPVETIVLDYLRARGVLR